MATRKRRSPSRRKSSAWPIDYHANQCEVFRDDRGRFHTRCKDRPKKSPARRGRK